VLNLTKHRAMKTYWGNGSISPRLHWPASHPGCFRM